MKHLALALLVTAWGCASTAGMSGPGVSGKLGDTSEAASEIQSNDILARDQVTARAEVKHILIGWRELAPNYDGKLEPRAAARSREEADALATEILRRVRAGEDFDALMRQYSEDQGSAQTAKSYTVTPDAGLVFEFKRLGMRLNVGEAGLVQSTFGWHIMKRIE
jgi:parvulin-like peptidyl-prolyl isomerase